MTQVINILPEGGEKKEEKKKDDKPKPKRRRKSRAQRRNDRNKMQAKSAITVAKLAILGVLMAPIIGPAVNFIGALLSQVATSLTEWSLKIMTMH
jgi:hypothetical protein